MIILNINCIDTKIYISKKTIIKENKNNNIMMSTKNNTIITPHRKQVTKAAVKVSSAIKPIDKKLLTNQIKPIDKKSQIDQKVNSISNKHQLKQTQKPKKIHKKVKKKKKEKILIKLIKKKEESMEKKKKNI